MKRFTETTKWDDAWFMELSAKHRFLWLYLHDRCDNAGVWKPNWRLASFHLGKKVCDSDLECFGKFVARLANGNIYLTNFVKYQNKTLSKKCPAHGVIYTSLEENDIDPVTFEARSLGGRVAPRVGRSQGPRLPGRVVGRAMDKDKGTYKDKGKDTDMGTDMDTDTEREMAMAKEMEDEILQEMEI